MKKLMVIPLLILFTAQGAAACTVLHIADRTNTVFAGNEDGTDPEARVWFVAPTDDRLGGVYFGFADGFRQAGLNSAGLCYDITACPKMALNADDAKIDPQTNLIQDAMDRCATVAEVVDRLDDYNLHGFERVQVVFADREGDAVVIDVNHVRRGGKAPLVVTNFYLSAPELGRHPCRRHEIAEAMIAEAAPTIDDARRILSAVRQEGRSQTQYSHICEPRRGRVTLYRFHDFEQALRLDLAAELEKGDREVLMSDLFPDRNFAAERWAAKQERKLSAVFRRTLDESGLEAAIDQYEATKIEHSEILNELADLGFGLQGDGRLEAATAAFELMTRDFPTFARGFEWYGNALTRGEAYVEAAQAYRRCLDVDPGNANARDVLGQIEAALAAED